jgi:hypothetical protein
MPDTRATDLDRDAIEWLTAHTLAALARAESIDPVALTLLVRRYAETERPELSDAAGMALARALEDDADGPLLIVASRLMMFIEAAVMSEDDRVRAAVAHLASTLRVRWDRVDEVEEIAAAIDACLNAADVLDPREVVPSAIDKLEAMVGAAYHPGAGIARRVDDPDGDRGRLGAHVRAASALLAGYHRTGRLPYAMLAEELMQFARRNLWAEHDGGFFDRSGADRSPAMREKPFELNCEAARVLCRLAVLHDMKEYRALAVVAPGTDYGADAFRALASLGARYRDHGTAGAVYAVALGECLML